jgi:hypothetical protein
MPQERWTNFLVNTWPPWKVTALWRLLAAKAGKEPLRLMRRCVRARLAGRHPEIQVRYIKHLNVTHNLEALDSCNVYNYMYMTVYAFQLKVKTMWRCRFCISATQQINLHIFWTEYEQNHKLWMKHDETMVCMVPYSSISGNFQEIFKNQKTIGTSDHLPPKKMGVCLGISNIP